MEEATILEAKARRVAWWKAASKDERATVAAAAGTKVGYLRSLVYGHRRPLFEKAQRLEAASGVDRKWWLPEAWG